MTERRSELRRHPGWLFWDPHQGLWNRHWMRAIRALSGSRLVRAALIRVLIHLDTALLWLRVTGRRLRELGPAALFARVEGRRILYLDCGTYREAAQLRAVHRWFAAGNDLYSAAFEASPDHCAAAREATSDLAGLTLHNVALVSPDHEGDSVRLYLSERSGAGDSVVAQRSDRWVDVPAARLSALLTRMLAEESRAVVLRANIEGAEYGVIRDLAEAGLLNRIDGFMGMWDDVAKIDPDLDEDFRALLAAHHIRTCTFNDRDMSWRWRVAAIRYDFGTSVLRGALRLERDSGAVAGR